MQEQIVTEFNSQLQGVIDLFLDIYAEDKDVHEIHALISTCLHNLPYKIIDSIGEYAPLVAKHIVAKDTKFFASDEFKISDDETVLKFTNMFKKYWQDLTPDLQNVIFTRMHILLAVHQRYIQC